MKTLFASLAVASIAAMTVGTASANDTFKVEISYYRAAPVAQSYAQIEKTAASACVREYRRDFSSKPPSSLVNECQAEVVAKAVEAAENAELAAFHGSKAGGRAYTPAY